MLSTNLVYGSRYVKNGMFMCRKNCALTVLLEDHEYENFIGVVSILKVTYFVKVDFINTFLMDFCLLLYISECSGKTMAECNVMVIEMGKNSDAVSDNDYSSNSKTQLHLNFQNL